MYQTKSITFLHSLSDSIFSYLSLTKPRIVILLSLTGVVGYLYPNRGQSSIEALVIFVIIGYLTSGGAMTINNYIDRDIDILMDRTSARPSVGEDALPSLNVVVFGTTFATIGLLIGYFYFGVYTFLHLAWGVLFYIFGYSLVLKRKSVLNTIIGGLASPAPVWAAFAARGEITASVWNSHFLGVPLEGWMLGGLVFIWTPSHTWALSAKNIDDYTRVNIPMLPVRLGMKMTSWLTLTFGILTITFGIIIATVLDSSNMLPYVMIIPNLIFFWSLVQFTKNPIVQSANNCFRHHNIWLATYFVLLFLITW